MIVAKREKYIQQLLDNRFNGLVKIVTGGRRCGKSFLLFNLFHQALIEEGVSNDHLIELSFDDRRNKSLCDPDKLLEFIDSKISKDEKTNYIILDEIQLVNEFVSVLLSLMHLPHVEIYVSGSNSKFLSKDIATEFRGRGQEIRIWPLSFAEYYEAVKGERSLAYQDYYTYGGLPQILQIKTVQAKRSYLKEIYEVTYLKDVIDRNHIRNQEGLVQLIRVLASSIGSCVNANRISKTFDSVIHAKISDKTIDEYIHYLENSFLIEEALRFDIKGRKYIGALSKFYFSDLGLRNIILQFRQQEETHIMENIIYNELRERGYLVDVGVVETWNTNKEKKERVKLEVDFVVNNGADKLYIQSAYKIPDELKEKQERKSLVNIDDGFRKMIIVKDEIKRKIDDDGVITIGLFDFLLDKKCTETIV